jgi:hypothetical protein
MLSSEKGQRDFRAQLGTDGVKRHYWRASSLSSAAGRNRTAVAIGFDFGCQADMPLAAADVGL